eukprot:gene29218-38287_t
MEKAAGCIDDLRHNKSGNVSPSCVMSALRASYDSNKCCPKFAISAGSKGLDMQYLGSAYPETFGCLEKAGCKTSLIYQELDIECSAACGQIKDPRPSKKSGSVCHATFNSSNRNAVISTLLSCLFIVVSTTYLL